MRRIDETEGGRLLQRYGTAVLCVLIAAAISRALDRWVAPQTTSPYFAAVLLSAVAGGAGPGLLATLLASLALAWFDLGSTSRLDLGADDVLRLAVFTITALVISSVSAARKAAEHELRIALERLAAVDRAKDEFIATLSHELRTPLTSILGWLHILRDRDVDEPTRDIALSSIEQSARIQQMLVNDMLDVSRIVLGKLELRKEPLVLQEVVDQAIAIVRPQAAAKQIEITSNARPSPLVIDGDRDRIKQVIWNLVINAVKFTPPGGNVRVSVQSSGELAEIEVIDDGEGIDADLLPHIFERFSQGQNGHKGGLGLGLAIVRHITELHGGSVNAFSAGRGKGSRFSLLIPTLAARRSS